jgi:hypothetical protein
MRKSYIMNVVRFCRMLPVLFLVTLSLSSCRHEASDPPLIHPSAIIQFSHWVNGSPLSLDTMIYSTSTGNAYMVNDLQYFISDVVFYRRGGMKYYITEDDSIHYTDIRILQTLSWNLETLLPEGMYDSVAFVFGMNEQRNRSNRFSDPPERDMFWPDVLGGGYHYMKMNLKWKNDTMPLPEPFNFHLGIGQIYSRGGASADSIIGFVQNFFTVTLPLSSFEIRNNSINILDLRMNIEKWFDGEVPFNFTDYPNGTMQDESAIEKACRNGRHAFEIHSSK